MFCLREITCLVLGGKGVGKTALICKLSQNGAPEPEEGTSIMKTQWQHDDTIFNIKIKEITIHQDFDIKKYSEMSDSLVFAFVYDITSRDSFERVLECLKSMVENKAIDYSARVLLVGNKADKVDRCVEYEEAYQLGKLVGSFIEVSAFSIDRETVYQTIFDIEPYSTFKTQLEQVFEVAPAENPQFSQASPPQVQFIKQSKKFSHLINFIIIGAQKTGKTQFLQGLDSYPLNQEYLATIGVDFKHKYARMGETQYKFLIWDTSGAQKFETICNSYYRGCHIFIIMYDITDSHSFDKIASFKQNIDKFAGPSDLIRIALVGNKSDRETERKISREEGQKVANQVGALFFEMSCKDENTVKECLLKAAECFIVGNWKTHGPK